MPGKGQENFKQGWRWGTSRHSCGDLGRAGRRRMWIDELASVEDQAKSKKGVLPGLGGAEQREMMGDYQHYLPICGRRQGVLATCGDERADCGLQVPPEQAATLPYKVEASWPSWLRC